MDLPTKVESVTKIRLKGKERTVYRELHNIAIKRFKAIHPGMITTKTLEILSYLLPLRKACSGGILTGNENGILEECPICLDMCENPVKTKCNHLFCGSCITSLIESNTGTEPCPICRTDLKIKDLSFGGGGGAAAAAGGAGAGGGGGGGGAAAAAGSAGAGGTGEAASKLAGTSFKAKLKVLLSDLRKIRKKDAKVSGEGFIYIYRRAHLKQSNATNAWDEQPLCAVMLTFAYIIPENDSYHTETHSLCRRKCSSSANLARRWID